MGNIQSFQSILSDENSDQKTINDLYSKSLISFMTESPLFGQNQHSNFVVIIFVFKHKGIWHALFHHNGKEDRLGFVAGKVDMLPVPYQHTREKVELAAAREMYEEAGIPISLPHLADNRSHLGCDIEILYKFTQKTTTVFVVKAIGDDTVNLNRWKTVCQGPETKNIVGVPLSDVAKWDLDNNQLGDTGILPRKYSITTFRLLIHLIRTNKLRLN
jgi:8-oxo-dGTP pyrophosphatase MutT (NUDIX family)